MKESIHLFLWSPLCIVGKVFNTFFRVKQKVGRHYQVISHRTGRCGLTYTRTLNVKNNIIR